MKKAKFIFLIIFAVSGLILSSCACEEPENKIQQILNMSSDSDNLLVSLEEANEFAIQARSMLCASETRTVPKIDRVDILLPKTRSENSEYGFYLINYENEQGFSFEYNDGSVKKYRFWDIVYGMIPNN